jgi:hypothetical protein
VDYQKIDAALAAALENIQNPDERSLDVFVFTTETSELSSGDEKITVLNDLGINAYYANRRTFTATLSPIGVEILTEESWVRYLKLSRKLDLAQYNTTDLDPAHDRPDDGLVDNTLDPK